MHSNHEIYMLLQREPWISIKMSPKLPAVVSAAFAEIGKTVDGRKSTPVEPSKKAHLVSAFETTEMPSTGSLMSWWNGVPIGLVSKDNLSKAPE